MNRLVHGCACTSASGEADRRFSALACLASGLLSGLLAGCAGNTPSIVEAPMGVVAPHTVGLAQRPVTGAIFQVGMTEQSLFVADFRARRVGDLIKVQIAEKLVATTTSERDTRRESSLAAKGPGSSGGKGVLSRIMDLDAKASGSNGFKGSGTAGTESNFDGQLVASVINVLPNGNLVLAGERVTSLAGNVTALRFAGIVHPRDIKPGHTVSSNDVAHAKLEVVQSGDVSEATRQRWIQRVLTQALSLW